tara:strand:+ start:349 stop:762 length:414 start_codon:yes stop_codon:yes gene_type:complete
MIRNYLTTATLTVAALTAPVQADTVRGALCELTRLNPTSAAEAFKCDFSQLQGNVYISGSSWKFAFPAAEQGKTYQRHNSDAYVRFTREGEYALTVYQSGVKPMKQGSSVRTPEQAYDKTQQFLAGSRPADLALSAG